MSEFLFPVDVVLYLEQGVGYRMPTTPMIASSVDDLLEKIAAANPDLMGDLDEIDTWKVCVNCDNPWCESKTRVDELNELRDRPDVAVRSNTLLGFEEFVGPRRLLYAAYRSEYRLKPPGSFGISFGFGAELTEGDKEVLTRLGVTMIPGVMSGDSSIVH